MLQFSGLTLPLSSTREDAFAAALARAGLSAAKVADWDVTRLSVDARHGRPKLVWGIGMTLVPGLRETAFAGRGAAVKTEAALVIRPGPQRAHLRPVVCGFGPAGIFAALLLARSGARPIVLERGPCIERRAAAVDAFFAGGPLDENANIQFGEGGAGTFSDGKLTTRIGDPLCDYVRRTLLEHGAPREIAWRAKPHIGTDRLRGVITSLRREIEELGGEVRFDTRLTGLEIRDGRIAGARTAAGVIGTDTLVLAIGHSARDTFEMLREAGVRLEAKPFSVGLRAEHLQADIDRALYHGAAGHPALPPGEYQLSAHVGGRGVYTFCMCPGGQVVAAASETGGLCTNGMSFHARDGANANAAVVVGVDGADFGGDPLQAVAFQRKLERAAFALSADGRAPAQDMKHFLAAEPGFVQGRVRPTYPRGVAAADLGALLPQELAAALRGGLRAFGARLPGYCAEDAVLTGPETRTSSPVRIPRGEGGESSALAGLYPCGEGAGYAGGIVSAAVDGLRAARSILERCRYD
ncbi:hypothetical protein H8S23_10900 [Anaerofilum sp. BX8]|uniref:FAD-dependent protein C-terminal domain-containing protein n=1 Tax=Anaerofilum hominis TaxID=2763016 RepID=A0A923IBN9_9FIRM|nr:hypothetical protein [Anaerofilum hominis]MBC5582013.1 hypothetical protein [Anaerofilum hominis]